ncbi:phosphoribosylglycinamide formyltransferase [Candidatus Peribacteria bacterium RIFCSPLOWO2_12_FULL_55_15]|nr:MAG: phosphoribosylglycinamide formyltransferase [Candidatus Peribacteria bacterium RIFCSPHIGHO2_01_FULL_54_22]OGJ63567.1 MAG: phosphoribosylglycinamide formyltransferase [Candidatus Peribacteria bacterium RIFCSPHIGHO2_02_FULL_55_24]OGJ63814.1 MAG: phosphoribosylglycinamide formyltransferase [Candidatus Peribacteria bacterium RIFCSPHIGHO2_12_FULL_54_10]OGJ67643.1 MAG: phosphoribosylglycinamide formyltransferase [Candidatus Peribacteria bacterium RIFCSPLOWO2_01_FULL_54_110]OGJ69554.1 MAG: pho
MNFIVLSSSGGTTFQAVIDRIADGFLTARCLGLVTDRADRGCIEKARKANLPARIVERKNGWTRDEYDRHLDHAILDLFDECRLSQKNPLCHPEVRAGLIACIGWMWLLSPWFVRTWRGRILNVHPALLPLHPGRHPHEEVLATCEKESGMTIHWVDEGVDTGPIIVQKKCSVLPGDTLETLKTRVQELEKEWYPKVLQKLDTQPSETVSP